MFSQRKNIKEQLTKTKTPLIKASEELNYRLWNLSEHIDKKWLNIDENDWNNEDRYYLRSFAYRVLLFLYWVKKSEDTIYSFDFSQADRKDNEYLKYVKTLKHFLCERELLEELGYSVGMINNHFYKDELLELSNYIEGESGPIDYKEFEEKFKKGYSEIKKLIVYLNEVDSQEDNKNYNVLMSFHLFLILFLNKYGLEYHKTKKKKIKELINNKYYKIKIKDGLKLFFDRNKVKKEAKWIITELGKY